MVLKPDGTLENADWPKSGGPAELGITNRRELALWLAKKRMTWSEFVLLPIFYRSRREWLRILGK
jgi:hypothetical protein